MNLFYFLLIMFFYSPQIHGYFFLPTYKKPFTILIEAQGNANAPGRTIDDSFESEITFNTAHYLKNLLEHTHSTIRVMVQRADGFANANVANKMAVDLYLSISACKGSHAGIYLFQFNNRDQYILKEGISFVPCDQIYLLNQSTTNTWIKTISSSLAQHHILKGTYAFPYRALSGVKAPAIAIELLLKNKSDATEYINILAGSLASIIKG